MKYVLYIYKKLSYGGKTILDYGEKKTNANFSIEWLHKNIL